MATRSSRNKIRWQLEAAMKACDKVMEHLSLAEQYSEERSPIMNDSAPSLTLAMLELQKAIERLREEI